MQENLLRLKPPWTIHQCVFHFRCTQSCSTTPANCYGTTVNKVKVQVILSIGDGSSIGKKLAQTYGFINTTFNESDIAWWTGTYGIVDMALAWASARNNLMQSQDACIWSIWECLWRSCCRFRETTCLVARLTVSQNSFGAIQCSILLQYDKVGICR